MSTGATRIERDSMGDVAVPAEALWGAGTQRAIENFRISGRRVPIELIHALAQVKAACAEVNGELGLLDAAKAEAIVAAAKEISAGKLDAHFPIDVFQTGSGTSTNTNVNEVIVNRVNQMRGLPLGSREFVHPNDHVNLGQSSNDVFPTAIHLATAMAMRDSLRPALLRLQESLAAHAQRWDAVVKVGRTHLMDAVPIRMGQVFSGWASQVGHSIGRVDHALLALGELPIGGTAVGTGLNSHPQFGRRVCESLTQRTHIHFREASNHFEAQAARDALVDASGDLRTVAVSLSKISNDIRLMGSGPSCGLGELKLPAIQPGSSIMPGKVNPVICESVIQVACRVIGNDATITTANLGGVGSILELNVAMPVIADAIMESINLLTNACNVMVERLLTGLEVDAERCAELVEKSLMMATALAPVLGYDTTARLVKESVERGLTIRQVVRERGLIDVAKLNELLDPRRMTEPGGTGSSGG